MMTKAEYQHSELVYLIDFAVRNDSGDPLAREQLRALWTAYCFHTGMLVDTAPYDNKILHLWTEMEDAKQTRGFKDFDDFDGFMCEWLV